jgi:hypothetical protein
MKKGMRRYGWVGMLVLGGIIGVVSYRALRPTERALVWIFAPQGVRQCKMAVSIETEAVVGGSVTADGKGVLACDQRSEVNPGLWVGCMCLDGDSTSEPPLNQR